MIVKTVKVSEKGQIAIPQMIREEAHIERGDELIIIQENGKIFLEKIEDSSLRDDFKDLKKHSELSLKEIWDNEQDDVWNEYLEK